MREAKTIISFDSLHPNSSPQPPPSLLVSGASFYMSPSEASDRVAAAAAAARFTPAKRDAAAKLCRYKSKEEALCSIRVAWTRYPTGTSTNRGFVGLQPWVYLCDFAGVWVANRKTGVCTTAC